MQVTRIGRHTVIKPSWETYEPLGDRVNFLGFSDSNGGAPVFVPFTEPVLYARLPFAVDSWTGTIQANPSEGTIDIEYTMSYVGQEDLPAGVTGPVKSGAKQVEPQFLWIDSFKAILEYELADEMTGTVFTTGSDTLWFAPTVGLVRSSSREVEPGQGTFYNEESFLDFFEPMVVR